jgi:hypothetical protein
LLALTFTLGCSAALAGGMNPAKIPVHYDVLETSDTAPAGHLEWNVIEVSTGASLSSGSRNLTLADFSILQFSHGELEKRLKLDRGFYLKLDPPSEKTRPFGFALSGAKSGEHTFCWEWFTPMGTRGAKKIQERGQLTIETRLLGGEWQTILTKLDTDISIRVMPRPSLLQVITRSIKWRINLKQGSEIRWPVVKDKSVVSADAITSATI